MNTVVRQDGPDSFTVVDPQTGATLDSAGVRRWDGREAQVDLDMRTVTSAARALKALVSQAHGKASTAWNCGPRKKTPRGRG
jgi:hypothetical protein